MSKKKQTALEYVMEQLAKYDEDWEEYIKSQGWSDKRKASAYSQKP